jgi:hypothetical protein
MSYKVQKIANLRTIKALRGQSLTIDLGKTNTGTLSAWMKRNPTDSTYRSFTIVDGRFLFLPKEKAQDLSSTDLVEGKWYFDVRKLPNGSVDPNDEQTIYTGTIDFSNNITDSNGSEVTTTPELESGMINLSNTSSVYGTVGQVVKAKELIKDVSEVKTIKAIRGESLSIDLGKTYNGYKLEAWMKKNPNDPTYRSFTIVDDKFLFLSKSKTQDYYDIETGKLIEQIAGKWYFDVRAIPTSATSADDEQIVTKGVIYFEENVTDSLGQELVYSQREYASSFTELNDTPLEYLSSDAGKALLVNSTASGVIFQEIIQDKHYTHDQGMPSQVWTINHGLNKFPAVVAVDTAGSVVVGQIQYIDLNNITITFNASFSGEAFIN